MYVVKDLVGILKNWLPWNSWNIVEIGVNTPKIKIKSI
jgi:hypothetical protein